MQWIIGGLGIVGVGGVVTLSIVIARMASKQRHDLRQFINTVDELSDEQRENDKLRSQIEEQHVALEDTKSELERQQKAHTKTRAALGKALEKLSESGTADETADDLRSALRDLANLRLSEESPRAEETTPTESGDDS